MWIKFALSLPFLLSAFPKTAIMLSSWVLRFRVRKSITRGMQGSLAVVNSLIIMFTDNQCQINNSSKCSNCYWPHAFGGLVVLRVKFVLYNMEGWVLELRCPRQTHLSFPVFYTCRTKTLFAESKLNFSLWWKYISYCKSFEVIWF